jgi:hypothetical protein
MEIVLYKSYCRVPTVFPKSFFSALTPFGASTPLAKETKVGAAPSCAPQPNQYRCVSVGVIAGVALRDPRTNLRHEVVHQDSKGCMGVSFRHWWQKLAKMSAISVSLPVPVGGVCAWDKSDKLHRGGRLGIWGHNKNVQI